MATRSLPNKKASGPSLFKKIAAWLHLWMGLLTGIVVVIISITGAIYVFEREFRGIAEPWRFVKEQKGPMLSPAAVVEKALPAFAADSLKPNGITYGIAGEAAEVRGTNRKSGVFVRAFVDPYNGKVVHVKRLRGKSKAAKEFDFFRFILDGHRTLWLPREVGHMVVGCSVLMFFCIAITGLVLWWPKKWTKAIRDKSFKIKFDGSFKRTNYDLHNVLGFYSSVFLIIISLTGLIWSFQWVSRSVYWATSGGRSLTEKGDMRSDTLHMTKRNLASIDKVWERVRKIDEPKGYYISIPVIAADAIGITAYLREGTYYKTNVYQFDQYSLKQLKASGPFSGRYADASTADKLRRMNYDIHVGAILGIPGKIIAFIVALISASLPITGFYIWWGKRNKKPAARKRPTSKGTAAQPKLVLRPNVSTVEA